MEIDWKPRSYGRLKEEIDEKARELKAPLLDEVHAELERMGYTSRQDKLEGLSYPTWFKGDKEIATYGDPYDKERINSAVEISIFPEMVEFSVNIVAEAQNREAREDALAIRNKFLGRVVIHGDIVEVKPPECFIDDDEFWRNETEPVAIYRDEFVGILKKYLQGFLAKNALKDLIGLGLTTDKE